MGWRVATSLEVLRGEINAIAPDRSITSDGSIGDPAHSSRTSDHNPNAAGVVCARDFTHDPGAGADMHAITEHLRTQRHPALKYLIWDRRIASSTAGWAWRSYSGSNPHTKHAHVSVHGPYDDPRPWGIGSTSQEDDMTPEQDQSLRAVEADVKYLGSIQAAQSKQLGVIEQHVLALAKAQGIDLG